MKAWKVGWAAFGFVAAGIYLNNSSMLSGRPAGSPIVLAHRGLAQDFDREGLTGETCTAERMLPPRHGYLENTIDSMDAAFRMGADVVEFDIHPTTDGQFAVFHDWTLDCRTEATGRTRDHDMATLKRLDVGYGYTADDGKTYPFRGKGVGLMPSLTDVLERFPGRHFHVNVKGNEREEGDRLAAFLRTLDPEDRARLTVYGGDIPIQAVKRAIPAQRVLSRASLKQCLLRYLGIGWTGYVPSACRGTSLLLPVNVAGWLWGWPNRFLDRMDAVGTRAYLVGPYAGGFSEGLNERALIEALPAGYSGGISTDALDVVEPAIKSRR